MTTCHVLFKKTIQATSGDIVLATVSNHDPILRVYSKNGNQVRPEGTGKTKAILANGATIVGKVVGVIRKL